jgi:hypothetical protein
VPGDGVHYFDRAGLHIGSCERPRELDDAVGPKAIQFGRHGQHDPRPPDPNHILGCGDLAEEIGRDLADLVASFGVIASGRVDDGVAKAEAFTQLLTEIELQGPPWPTPGSSRTCYWSARAMPELPGTPFPRWPGQGASSS